MDYRSVCYFLSLLVLGLLGAFMVPYISGVLIFKEPLASSWIGIAFLYLALGGGLFFSFRSSEKACLGIRETFLMTSVGWVGLSLLAALPLYVTPSLQLDFISCWFEAASALTTTGGTTLVHLESVPKMILLWRALLQWLGGMGIIVIAMAVFPVFRVGGMQLFQREFSDRSEKFLPRLSKIALALMGVYITLTVLCFCCLSFAGLSSLDSLCHALSTLSTGGFSTRDTSIAAFQSPSVEWILIVFMIMGGSPLIIYVRWLYREKGILLKESQVLTFLSLILVASLAIGVWRCFENPRHTLFSVVSILTSTGFVVTDYGQWGGFPSIVFLFLAFLGGCTGSTSGGLKIFRLQIMGLWISSRLKRLKKPMGVYVPLYQGKSVSEDTTDAVLSFFIVYIACWLILSILLSLCNLDVISSLSASAGALGNVGPGLGNLIGPSGSYAHVGNIPKLILIMGMILGRLEIVTVLMLFLPFFWRR